MDDQQYQDPTQAPTPASRPPALSGLSGNEMYCAALLGYRPGNIIVGNSVFSMGITGGLHSEFKAAIGGELTSITSMIQEGRKRAFGRVESEVAQYQGCGVTGVTNDLLFQGRHIEFLSIGSALHRSDGQVTNGAFTSSADGQELYCMMDAGFAPISFVFGNVAYAIGIGRNFFGELRTLAKGEVTQYSNVFNTTRQRAIERIANEAREAGANSVVGIRTSIQPFETPEVQEMVMTGTAVNHQAVSQYGIGQRSIGGVVTSDLTAEEMWNVVNMGYMPIQLVLGTSVYSLGVIGGIRATLKNMIRGEITTETQMIYGAREQSLKRIMDQAQQVGADDVLGIKTYVYELGTNLLEFLAIGTAVKRIDGLTTRSQQLPPQAIIRDKDTFVNTAQTDISTALNNQQQNPSPQTPPSTNPQQAQPQQQQRPW